MSDALVIGSGPNGLVAANVLADAGWEVMVLEANDVPGGAVRSAEVAEPGFCSDLFSAFYPLAAGSPVIRDLQLEDHGLRWCRSALALAHPMADGRAAFVSQDLGETVANLDSFAPGDGDRWRGLVERWAEVGEPFLQTLMTPFPPLRAGARLAMAAGPSPRELLRFVRFVLLPVRRLADELFRGEGAKLLFGGNALHTDLTPEATTSGLFGWLLAMLAQTVGFPVPEGGAGQLTDALLRRLASRGGRIECGQRVSEVVVRDGRAVAVRTSAGDEIGVGRAVLADCDALSLYRKLIDPVHLPATLLDDLERFQLSQATIKVDWALSGPVGWSNPDVARSACVHIAGSIDELTMTAAQLSSGQVPDKPFLLFGQMAVADPTRAPAGAEVAWAYTHVPQHVRGDAGGQGIGGHWDDGDTHMFVERMEARVEAHAPGFRDLVIGRHVFTPAALEAADANLVGGDLIGGTSAIHQQLVFRPTPGWGRPETPVKGLYLASASAHPGGGVHGACGANAARAAIAHDRLARVRSRLRRGS